MNTFYLALASLFKAIKAKEGFGKCTFSSSLNKIISFCLLGGLCI